MEEIELDFGAITLDNSILKGEGYKFYEGLLAQMEQFKESPVKVIQTDIVHNEAIKHIGKDISNARSSINSALRSAKTQLKIKVENINRARDLLSVDGSEEEIAEAQLEKYYEFIGAQKIDSDKYTDLSVLMEMYFSTKAPFETGKDKKNEFPDAIALLSLQHWAEEKNINIVAVSQDKGWKNFSETSNRITVVSSLAEALEMFQPHNKVASIINHIQMDSLFDDDNNHLLGEITQAIIDSLDGCDIEVEANSSTAYYLEWDDVFASYSSHELDRDDTGLVKVRVIRIDDKSIVLKVGAIVEVEVQANFYFSIKDSIDKDYIYMGKNVCSILESYHTDILLTLTGDFSKNFDQIKVAHIEVLEAINYADFDLVEYDSSSEYEGDEYEDEVL